MAMAFRALPTSLILVALSVMVLLTWRTTWLGPTVDSVGFLEFRWFAPVILGYGNPFPLLCLGATVLALVLSLARGVGGRRGAGGRRGIALELVLGVAIAAAALGAVLLDGLHGWALAAPALLLLCLLVVLLLLARARVPGAEIMREGLSPGTDPGPTRGS